MMTETEKYCLKILFEGEPAKNRKLCLLNETLLLL